MEGYFPVHVSGPLGPYALGFQEDLARRGYTPFSARVLLELTAHLSGWLAARGVPVSELSEQVAGRYLPERRAAGYTYGKSVKVIVPLLSYLRVGKVIAPVAGPRSAAQEFAEEFRGYLVGERGLTGPGARGYVDAVRPFLAGRQGPSGLDLVGLRAVDVSGFVLAEAARCAPKTVQRKASALRSLLGYLYVRGLIPVALAGAVPAAACRPGLVLPKYLEPGQVHALLAGCDRGSANGRRDYAVLLLLVRMGLRCGEVAGLRLEDLDWRRGQITVRGKGNRVDRLPLPGDVADALVAYLSCGRPAGALDRRVFIRVKAPAHGLTGLGVTQIVVSAGKRAGLGEVTGHRLRHTAATGMLRAGAPLEEIAQTLRHRSTATTALYAKVDIEGLRDLGRDWTGQAS
jgi:integrase/recombinase XerD